MESKRRGRMEEETRGEERKKRDPGGEPGRKGDI
jgi:hypothetical protein